MWLNFKVPVRTLEIIFHLNSASGSVVINFTSAYKLYNKLTFFSNIMAKSVSYVGKS